MKLSVLLSITLTLLALPALAQVYEIRDASGRVIGYSDTPPADGSESRQIEVTTPNTASPPPVVERPPEAEPQEADEEAPSYKVAITSPANETGIPMGGGDFAVRAAVDPALRSGDSLLLMMDGVPWGAPQTSSTWALTNVFRGAHDLTVQVIDEEGESLAVSEAIRVYVQRPSVISRARRGLN